MRVEPRVDVGVLLDSSPPYSIEQGHSLSP